MFRLALLLVVLVSLLAGPLAAQMPERRPSHCIALAQAPGLAVIPVAFRAPLPDHTIRIAYLDHAMFAIRSPGGVIAVTDYAGYLGAASFVPDIATMNRAHSTHWTGQPDPRIPHILPGWGEGGAPNLHYLELGDLLVRNVQTDIRSSFSGLGANGNSIFVFELAGLCVGHLGHLHHEPTAAQYAALGRLDVVMAPVDGGMTLDLPSMLRVLGRLRASVVIPMHWFGRETLERFLLGMEEGFAIDRRSGSMIELSLQSLPSRPTVVVLQPRLMTDAD